MSALHAKFNNDTQVISIEYENPQSGSESTYYKGLMEVDLATFIFREVSFSKILKSELRPLNSHKIDNISASSKKKVTLNTAKSVGTVKNKGDYDEK